MLAGVVVYSFTALSKRLSGAPYSLKSYSNCRQEINFDTRQILIWGIHIRK